MTQRDERHRQPDLRDSQLAIPFPSRRLLDPQRRVEVVALLARLLTAARNDSSRRKGGRR